MFKTKNIDYAIFLFLLSQLLLGISIVAANGTEYSVVVDDDGDVGKMSSLAIVDGYPAVAYEDHDNRKLKYARALDAQGKTWGNPQTLDLHNDDIELNYRKIELRVVNGNPAIAFYDYEDEDLYFIRATDAQGNNWGAPVCADCSDDDTGEELSMAVINGNPAIVYLDYDNDAVLFVRATDADGTAWGTPVLVSGVRGDDIEIVVADGKPAISYFDHDNYTVEYVLADDANGTTWGAPQILDTLSDYDELAMAIINGNPAVAYYDYDNEIMYYIRATNADGTSWGTRIVVRENDYVDSYHELAVIDGYPTIAYQRNSEDETDDDLALIQASDANGTSWKEPRTLLSDGDIGEYNSIIPLQNSGLGVTTHGGDGEDLFYFSYLGSVEPDTEPPTVVFGANTIPTDGDRLIIGPTQITIEFSEKVTQASAESKANYLLVEIGQNDIFDTTSCAVPGGGTAAPDDIRINVNTVTYDDSDPFITTLEINDGLPLPLGTYRLFICGTTSIEDLAGFELNGGTSDTQINFSVIPESSTLDTAGSQQGQDTSPTDSSSLPETGFRPGQVTSLGEQPVAKPYTNTDMLLEIPKLSLIMPIVGVPQSSESWDVNWLGNRAGYLSGTAFPTYAGNTVLTAHVWNADNTPGPFVGLHTLKHSDEIIIHAWGQKHVYEVRTTEKFKPDDLSVLQHSEYDILTLITCQGFDEASGEYVWRLAVGAVLVAIE